MGIGEVCLKSFKLESSLRGLSVASDMIFTWWGTKREGQEGGKRSKLRDRNGCNIYTLCPYSERSRGYVKSILRLHHFQICAVFDK